ncbi:hypothetical protein J1N35_013746 [Gossypium stocksii]|uniref:Uncharacterized protein n=1 Tax=Gossypium stocksii TaxID=47602 RepID=A0A9D3VTG7_9ROSI|nr:hypothetical protein J1N35_013746 [Gossypium stocksii]
MRNLNPPASKLHLISSCFVVQGTSLASTEALKARSHSGKRESPIGETRLLYISDHQVGFESPTREPDRSHQTIECDANRKRIARGARGSSSHEPREGCSLNSHLPKELAKGRPRSLACNPERNTCPRYLKSTQNVSHRNSGVKP